MQALPQSNKILIRLIKERIQRQPISPFTFNANGDLRRISAVLFLLGQNTHHDPFLILNKRSRLVRQPGDLCCPGGGVSPSIDALIARWLHDFTKLSLLLATALREGFEEMRLNPFGIQFLGPMPAQHLVMFKRAIYPLVAWVNRQQRFLPNWEVEKIVRIPLAAFFDVANYARYRISFNTGKADGKTIPDRDMPCFVHRHNGEDELLWGATYRIVMQFLATVFGYDPPLMASLPVINRKLGQRYLKGSIIATP
jgi:8-oxo-dGTP pyrophosphatase MutT (NUDIX family)